MTERSYRPLLWVLALVGLSTDLGTKYGVFSWLYHHHLTPVYSDPPRYAGTYDVLPGVFQFHATFTAKRDPGDCVLSGPRTWGIGLIPEVNHGALFGLGREFITLANTLFAVVSLLAAVAIMYWSTRPHTARDGYLCAALGLILGGTLGNLFDRVVFNGVRDFLYFYWINWPVFNVADCCLVCGAGLLLVQAFWSPAPAEEPANAGAARLGQPVEVK